MLLCNMKTQNPADSCPFQSVTPPCKKYLATLCKVQYKHRMPTDNSKYHARFGIRTALLVLASCALLLPLGVMAFLRFQESALIRQAERELIAQGAIVVADYKQRIFHSAPNPSSFGIALPPCAATAPCRAQVTPKPNLARSHLFGPRPAAVDVTQAADPYAFGVGQGMNSLATEANAAMSTNLFVLDYQGIIVTGLSGLGDSLADIREVQLALNGNYAAVLRKGHDTVPFSSFFPDRGLRVHTALPVIEQGRLWGVVYLSKAPQDIVAQLVSSGKDLLSIAGLACILLVFLAIFAWRTIASPLRRLVNKINRLETDNVPANLLSHPGTKEVEQLARKFSKMSHALHARTEYIRDFAQHMSHELNQPLNGIRRSTAQLMDCAAQLPPECRQWLQAIAEDSGRLSRLLVQLLELARADNISPSGEVCYIMPILKRLSEHFSDDSYSVIIEGEGHYDTLISAESFESIMTKLLENARQHGASEARIAFSLHEQELTIRISNNGEPIPGEGREQVFNPFFTTRREQGGSGLGLGIARSLAEAYGGSIVLAPESGDGRTTFVLTVPVLP